MLRITKDGFLWLIVSKSEAKGIFFDKNREVYKLYDDGSEGLVESYEDIRRHNSSFGVEIGNYSAIKHNCKKWLRFNDIYTYKDFE